MLRHMITSLLSLTGLITTASPLYHLHGRLQVRMGSKWALVLVLHGPDLWRVTQRVDWWTNPAQVQHTVSVIGHRPTSIYLKRFYTSYYLVFPVDTVVSKVVIPRLPHSEQSGHMSPNKNTKVSSNQHLLYVILFLVLNHCNDQEQHIVFGGLRKACN